MLIILDDTFVDRHKHHNTDYLWSEKYKNVCKIYSELKTQNINQLLNENQNIRFLGTHKSLQLFNVNGKPLNIEDNSNFREVLLRKLLEKNPLQIEFSGGLETNFDSKKIDKELFYSNLKSFLDYYINNNKIELRILFWGEEFEKIEKMLLLQKMMIQMRIVAISDFKNNSVIKRGVDMVYGKNKSKDIINGWIERNFSANEILVKINNKIKF